MINPVIILGVNPISIAACEVFLSNQVTIFGFLDERERNFDTEIMGIPVLGHVEDDELLSYIGKSCDVFVALETKKSRIHFTQFLKNEKKVVPVNAFHHQAFFSPNNQFGHGNLVLSGANIAGTARVGNSCQIMHNAIVESGATLEDFVYVGSGSVICSGAHLSTGSYIGAGCTVVSDIKIGKNATVGAGSIVMDDLPSNKTFFGIPAKEIKI